MSLHNKTNVHPDLAKERLTASFDPENITVLLDGGDWLTKLRREMGRSYLVLLISTLKDNNFKMHVLFSNICLTIYSNVAIAILKLHTAQ